MQASSQPPPWRDSESGALLPLPYASSEAARFFAGASAAEADAARAAVACVAMTEAPAGMEAEADTDERKETALSDGSVSVTSPQGSLAAD